MNKTTSGLGRWGGLAFGLLLCCQQMGQAGPVSPYYVTDGFNTNRIYVIQGNSVTSFPDAVGAEYAIAVAGDVRTFGYTGGQGAQYTLAGNFTGMHYNNPGISSNGPFDGTTDGNFNYTVDFGTGIVYRTNRDWSSPTVLFNTGFGASNALGITYDPTNNSLWVSQWTGNLVADFSLGGAILSSFGGPGASLTSLALDHADNTLWMGTQHTGTYFQYDKLGNQLSSQTYSQLGGLDILGGEFPFAAGPSVPEPASMTLLVMAGASIGGCWWWKRRKSLQTAAD